MTYATGRCPCCGSELPPALDESDRKALWHKRRIARISLKELGRKIGVAGSAVDMWESGERRPTASHEKAWREALE